MAALVQPTYTLRVSSAQHDIGGARVQQDNGLRAEIVGSDGSKAVVAAVFDGHGVGRGERFSAICKDQLEAVLVGEDHFKDRFDANPEAVGRDIFSKMHQACFEFNKRHLTLIGAVFEERDGLIQTVRSRDITGGTTATVVIATDKGQVHCFNAGDSDAWLIKDGKATTLTGDHTPECPAEYARIQAACPETEHIFDYNRMCGMARREDGDHIFPKRDGFAGYYRKNLSGHMATLLQVKNGRHVSHLAMTRSIGDEPLRRGGVTWEPSYVSCHAGSNSVINIASDGYWDCIAHSDIVRATQRSVAKHGYDADALCRDWFETTERAARLHFGGSRDNMWGYTVTITK